VKRYSVNAEATPKKEHFGSETRGRWPLRKKGDAEK